MLAVARRELGSYFLSPIGYIILAAYYVLAGFYFLFNSLLQYSADLTSTFSSLFSVTLFIVPVITMRLFSEELRHKTDQALLTAPISITKIVLGKFIAACLVYFLCLAITLVYQLVFLLHTTPDWPAFWGNFTALLLLGLALVSIGMFLSSLTESQVIAAVCGFAVALLLLLIDAVKGSFQSPLLASLVTAVSFYDRYIVFTAGIFDFANLFFFLSVCAIFIFLTIRVLDKRRWS